MAFSLVTSRAFFSTVQYEQELADDSWLSKFESAADVCRAPSRWVAHECWGEGKKYIVTYHSDPTEFVNHEIDQKTSSGIQKVLRIVIGLILSVPGQIVAIPLMAIAYCSEETRLKHKTTVVKLTDEEKGKLAELIQKRQILARERQGCEPFSIVCLLCSICCLLCCLVCKR